MQKDNESQIVKEEPKKLIVVIGNKGHGKSSFVRMLACDEQKKSILISAGIESVTTESNIYKVNTTLQLFEGDLFVLDTMGLDSEESAFVVIEDIEATIINEMCEVVAIILVLDPNAGRIGEKQIMNFYKILKLRNSVKEELMFVIFSKYDKAIKSDETEEWDQKLQQYKQVFLKNKLKKVYDKHISWISEPNTEKGVLYFDKIRNNEDNPAHQSYKQQWIRLKQNINVVIKNKLYQKYKHFQKDRIEFEKILENKFQHFLKGSEEYGLVDRQITQSIVLTQKKPNQFSFKTFQDIFCKSNVLKKVLFSIPIFTIPIMIYHLNKKEFDVKIKKFDGLGFKDEKYNRLIYQIQQYHKKMIEKILTIKDNSSHNIKLSKKPWLVSSKISYYQQEQLSKSSHSIIMGSTYDPQQFQEIYQNKKHLKKLKLTAVVKSPNVDTFDKILKDEVILFYGKK